MDANIQIVPVPTTRLGEGPHWNAAKQELYYIDLWSADVCRYVPGTGEHAKVHLNINQDRLTLVVPVEGESKQYVVAVGRTLRLLEWDGKSAEPTSLETMFSVEPDRLTNRFNDGKCDTRGRLWAGTMDDMLTAKADSESQAEGDKEPRGNLFRVTDSVQNVQSDIYISNGIAWNSKNTLMYYIDTATRKVEVFDFDNSKGTISNRRTVYDLEQDGIIGYPDGMTSDADGNLWVALWGGCKLLQINPTTGKLLRSIEMPAKNVTSVAFGGPKLDILYVTTASEGMTEEEKAKFPDAGSLFKITNLGVKGITPGHGFRRGKKRRSGGCCCCC